MFTDHKHFSKRTPSSLLFCWFDIWRGNDTLQGLIVVTSHKNNYSLVLQHLLMILFVRFQNINNTRWWPLTVYKLSKTHYLVSTQIYRVSKENCQQQIFSYYFNLIFKTWYKLTNWDFHLKSMRHFHFWLFFGHLLISFIVVELITIIIADSYYEASPAALAFSCKIDQN